MMKLDVDEVLGVDSFEHIAELDRINPEWHLKCASSQSVMEWARKYGLAKTQADRDRETLVLKGRAHRELQNLVWLAGHAALQLKLRKGGQ